MYKKILAGLSIVLAGSVAFAADNYNVTFKGFQNIENFQKLNVVNNIQAVADNDGVEFSKLWPSEYFKPTTMKSFIYLAKNELDSLEFVRFNYPEKPQNCFTKDNPNFCIQKVQPDIINYIYNERLIVNDTPNFISQPNEHAISEVLIKDGKYFDTKNIKMVTPSEEEQVNILKDCKFDEFGYLMSCQTFNSDTEDLLYTEELVRKSAVTSFDENINDKVLKYIKYDSNDNKIEEYYYSNGKHYIYNDKGEIVELFQITPDKFKYQNKKLPDLYIDVEFTYDDNGREIQELHYDENHVLIRKYTAEYDNDQLSKIHVEDCLNMASWDILPIKKENNLSLPFAIRN